MLCQACQEIFQGDWLPESNPREHIKSNVIDGRILPHHETVDSLFNSAQSRCYICARVWRGIMDLGDETSTLLSLRCWQARNGGPASKYQLSKFGEIMDVTIFCQVESRFVLPKAEYAEYAISDYEVAPRTSAPSCLDLAYQWLDECISSHKICAQKSEDSVPFTPTRLLDIQNSGAAKSNFSCKLVVTSETRVQGAYMTLSHCWGAEPIKTLTSSTLEAIKVGIVISELPKTFQDAIVIARHLQVRYLWIDSLCIIQDSPEDWSREASAMKDVFANSTCNIAATWGENSSAGCFVARDPLLISPSKITTAWTGRGADSNCHLIAIEPDDWRLSIERGILNGRGWVIQERLLSPRVLHFGKEQIFWECKNSIASEAFPVQHQNDDRLGEQRNNFKKQVLSDFDGRPSPDFEPAQWRWQKIISSYMCCVLTRPEDKLIAISGIAKVFQSTGQGEYLAGLWRKNLPHQLLWHIQSRGQATGLPSVKSELYRAPSWSWASVDTYITWTAWGHDLITVQEAVVQTVTDDPTGQVRGGYIKLRGRVVKAEFREGEKERTWKIRIGDTTESDIEIKPDMPSADSHNQWRQGSFLPVLWDSFDRLVKGLLLRSVDAAETLFERTGYFDTSPVLYKSKQLLEMLGLREDREGVKFMDQDTLQTITLT